MCIVLALLKYLKELCGKWNKRISLFRENFRKVYVLINF